MENRNIKIDIETTAKNEANAVLGEFCGLPCQKCKHKNSVTVDNGLNYTRCRLQPHKDFWQIKAEDDFIGCEFQLLA